MEHYLDIEYGTIQNKEKAHSMGGGLFKIDNIMNKSQIT